MTVSCESGLFVGIDEYWHLRQNQRLRKAQDDARSLYSYFARIDGNGPYILFEEGGTKRLIRLTLIEEIHQWIDQVPRGKAGLFYFAGHAQCDSRGLVLAARDFKPAVPFDSGLPLRRLFELFRRAAACRKHFVVILDCRRDRGAGPARADDVPANVTVLYASPLETKRDEPDYVGGSLTHAIETVLKDASRSGERRLSLSSLLRRTESLWTIDAKVARPAQQLHGSHADRIILPLAPAPEFDSGASADCSEIRLDGFLQLPPKLLDMAIDRVREACIEWFGRDRDDEAEKRDWVNTRVLAKEAGEGKQLQVVISGGHGPLKPRILLTMLLNRFPSHFHHLVLTWNRLLDSAAFLPLAKQFPGSDHWTPLPENALQLTFEKEWNDKSTRCRIWVAFSSNRTEARVWGEIRELEWLALDKLMPEIAEWLDVIQSVSPTPEVVSQRALADPFPSTNAARAQEMASNSLADASSLIRVFVSYSHQDARFLSMRSLLGFMSGLEREGFTFWYDKRTPAGTFWDDEIKHELNAADVVLVLVSQDFLNSKYCTEVEVPHFVDARKKSGLVIFPVILSPCDWKTHGWLSSTTFEPRDGRTITKNLRNKGDRDELYLRILEQLREIGRKIRDTRKV